MKDSTCSVDGCERSPRSLGLCSAHHQRFLKHGDPLFGGPLRPRRRSDVETRFLSYVDLDEAGCCLWTGSLNHAGYGQFCDENSLATSAHRWAYIRFVGPVPDGLELDHLCRVRNCVNPVHLEPVTSKENTLRGIAPAAKYAVATHCIRGHAFDERNTLVHANGNRNCRRCKADHSRNAWRAKRGLPPIWSPPSV